MQINGSVVLVTGANRGIGAEFVRELKRRGAAKIYAAARSIEGMDGDGVELVALDVTDHTQVEAAAALAGDVQLLINNAGVSSGATLLGGDLGAVRRDLETNFFGPLAMTRAFAPILAANGGGAILNVVSALSWFSAPGATVYAATKAAAWSLTDGIRLELAGQGTQVLGLHMGLVDTDMTAGYEAEKLSPTELVTAALDGLEAGASEVLADETATFAKSSLTLTPQERYADLFAAQG
ncbi:short-subunit dehydrogenase [Glaciihabitans tibetensis]|uniref:Short-subunit dehydrogenase n=1 Tax=Glaciihabitans tibetensis TaxID=1266600 RepID=A0A2T0VA83_9MICO|nr:SDR family oxidoreductase [Glaciihabitans tibetensis]PRY67064.1 short-subunit dehydrogenase [Glaciihabitans tibetensis]